VGRDPVRAHAISIHAPARGATFILDMRIRQFLFQSTLPRGERPGLDRARLAEVRFQSTLPRGERLSPASSAPLLQNFNPRSREGSDRGLRDGGKYGINISIHAPAREATASYSQTNIFNFYFNPRSREGSDHLCAGNRTRCIHFNPRSREGSDSATAAPEAVCWTFQSTLPRGERLGTVGFRLSTKLFQSTLPRGERPLAEGVGICLLNYFNPRSREGSDSSAYAALIDVNSISIHAPARGATLPPTSETEKNYKFQSTLPRGERRIIVEGFSTRIKFQSTLPRGERL